WSSDVCSSDLSSPKACWSPSTITRASRSASVSSTSLFQRFLVAISKPPRQQITQTNQAGNQSKRPDAVVPTGTDSEKHDHTHADRDEHDTAAQIVPRTHGYRCSRGRREQFRRNGLTFLHHHPHRAMQRTRLGPAAKHDDGYNGDWESKHSQHTDNNDRENLCGYVVVSMMAIDIVLLAVAPIDGDPKALVFKFAIDPFLDLVRKLIGRGSRRRNRGGN